MIRRLLLGLCAIAGLAGRAGAIEIYSNGQKYASLEAYQAKKSAVREDSVVAHQLYVLGVEDGMAHALEDFYQSRTQTDLMVHKISLAQLQQSIQEAVSASKDPKLLISQPGKLRIMSLDPKDAP